MAATFSPAVTAADTLLETQRELFREAFAQAELGVSPREAAGFEVLESYPLYPDLHAVYLGARVSRVPDAEIEAALASHPGYADTRNLRYRWLNSLAKRKRWSRFLDLYEETYSGSDDAVLQCRALTAMLNTGRMDRFDAQAMNVWMVGVSQPKECDPVFAHLVTTGRLQPDDYERRMRLAVAARQFRLASYLARELGPDEAAWASQWSDTHANPAAKITAALDVETAERDPAILAYAFERLATSDPALAMDWWPRMRMEFDFDAEKRNRISRHIALRAAYRHEPAARVLLRNLPAEAMTDEAAVWWARLAIRAADWGDALAAIDALSATEARRDVWRYWKARSLQAIGADYVSEFLLMQLAAERSYYGFLAADRMGVAYDFQHEATRPDEATILRLSERPDLIRAREWFMVGLPGRGRLEWARAVRSLDPEERAQAALLAQRWGWHSRAISTAAQSGLMDDLELRYPTPFLDWFDAMARTTRAETTWALSVARSESLFMPDAGSSAGALGIMQLMPGTGRLTARELNLRYQGRASLLDPQTNIRLGTSYLGNMLARFEYNPVLATAAYNAGPHRVERWLPDDRALPADVWVDTIPFKETRRYVRRVLAGQAIFHWRLNGTVQRVTESMPPVRAPGPAAAIAGGAAVDSSL